MGIDEEDNGDIIKDGQTERFAPQDYKQIYMKYDTKQMTATKTQDNTSKSRATTINNNKNPPNSTKVTQNSNLKVNPVFLENITRNTNMKPINKKSKKSSKTKNKSHSNKIKVSGRKEKKKKNKSSKMSKSKSRKVRTGEITSQKRITPKENTITNTEGINKSDGVPKTKTNLTVNSKKTILDVPTIAIAPADYVHIYKDDDDDHQMQDDK